MAQTDSGELDDSRRDRYASVFQGFFQRWLLAGGPLIAALITLSQIDVEQEARTVYYEAVAQIIPLLVIVLALEHRYFFPDLIRPEYTPPPGAPRWEVAMLKSLRPAAHRAVHPRVGARVEPGVELQLEVELVGERAARFEASLEEVLQPLDDALACGSAGSQK